MARTVTIGPDDKVVVRVPLSPAERGRLGARKRWGEPRVIRLDDLTPDQRRFVLAVWEAARTNPDTEKPEVRRASDERPAA